MASWSVLTALSGYHFDLPNQTLGFAPRMWADDWRSFWSAGTGWGSYSQRLEQGKGEIRLNVDYGSLELKTLLLGSIEALAKVCAAIDGDPIEASASLEEDGATVSFAQGFSVATGQTLEITLEW